MPDPAGSWAPLQGIRRRTPPIWGLRSSGGSYPGVQEHVVLVALLIVHPMVVLGIAILHVTQSAQRDALSHVGVIAIITVTQIVQGFVLHHVRVIAIVDVPQIAKMTALIHVVEIAILHVLPVVHQVMT